MQNYPKLINFNTGIDNDMIKNIISTINKQSPEMEEALVGNEDPIVNKKIRNCKSASISRTHWINGLLDYYVRSVNDDVYNYDLVNWYNELQFLHYEGKGAGYTWHCDNGVEENEIGVRKITVILGLSDPDDYEGGELQVMMPGNHRYVNRLKLELGECVMFPSTSLHRVTPLKSGERSVIVGWYGGPDFR